MIVLNLIVGTLIISAVLITSSLCIISGKCSEIERKNGWAK